MQFNVTAVLFHWIEHRVESCRCVCSWTEEAARSARPPQDGHMPLYSAAVQGNKNAVKALLAAGALPDRAKINEPGEVSGAPCLVP